MRRDKYWVWVSPESPERVLMRHKGEKMYTLTQKVSKMTEKANERGESTSQGMPTIARNYQTLGERHGTVSPSKPPEY